MNTEEAILQSATQQQCGNDPSQYLNRELEWLTFNERVLAQASDPTHPLLERVRFLSIFSSNLDEFFMKRVGRLKVLNAVGKSHRSIDGLSPAEELIQIRDEVARLLRARTLLLKEIIIPELRSNGIKLLRWEELSQSEVDYLTRYFNHNIFPVVTPLVVDAAHPFPFVSNLSSSLAVALQDPDKEEKIFARIKTSLPLASWVNLPSENSQARFVHIADIIEHNLTALFPGMTILSAMRFRVTRDASLDLATDELEDLLDLVESGVRKRKFGEIVRLEVTDSSDSWLCEFIADALEVTREDIYHIEPPVDYGTLQQIAALDFPQLKFEPWYPITPQAFIDAPSVFEVIRASDLLVHHPYESFSDSVERFLREAATDPQVLAIKMTLYRVAEKDPIIPMLIEAAERGKQVVCLIEITARFDEERNLRLAQLLEDAGVHVVYGIVGLKTHAKTILVVRQEKDHVRCYAHIGTGNYHASNATLYTDLGLFTAHDAVTRDLVRFFNYLTGHCKTQTYEKLLVAPHGMKERFHALIEQEIIHHKAGKPAAIIAKLNSLTDKHIIGALYQASQAGVPIELYVRGICCLKPGVPALSPTIKVVSIVGRLLEHSRFFYFRNGAATPAEGIFIVGSPDWMTRNLNRRVEIAVPLEQPALKEQCWQLIEILQNDFERAWVMDAEGNYLRRHPPAGKKKMGTHRYLMNKTKVAFMKREKPE